MRITPCFFNKKINNESNLINLTLMAVAKKKKVVAKKKVLKKKVAKKAAPKKVAKKKVAKKKK